MKIALFGATSKTGRYVAAELVRRGHEITVIGRDADRLRALGNVARLIVADLTQPATLPPALADADIVASLAHAMHAPALLRAVPTDGRRVVFTGSLRRHTRLADPAADAVREAEALFVSSGRPGLMLHPSMIYGAPDDRNVNRVLSYLHRFPRGVPVPVPLPGGGRSTVQPVFVDDMVAAFVAAIERPAADGPPIAVAGPEPMTYRAFVEACAAALDRTALVIPFPLLVLAGAAAVARGLGLRMPATAAEFARTAESKAFDTTPLRERLGVVPRPFAEGLRLKIERGWVPWAA